MNKPGASKNYNGPDLITSLPAEIICEIVKHCGSKMLLPLMLAHRFFCQTVRGNLVYILDFGEKVRQFQKCSGFVAHPEQVLMLRKLKQTRVRWNLVEAPMGCGKTAVMLMTALESSGKSIILINTRIFTSWIQEVKNFGLRLHQDPVKSDVLLVHTKYPRHRNAMIKNQWEKDPFPDKKVLITTMHYFRHNGVRLRVWVGGRRFRKVDSLCGPVTDPDAPEGRVIVDEAHLLKGNQIELLDKTRNVRHFWFSASPLTRPWPGNPWCSWSRFKLKNNTKGYPKIRFTRVQTQWIPGGTQMEIHLPKIFQKKKFNYTHIIVFTNYATKALRCLAKNELRYSLPSQYKVLVFSNTAPTILERWRKASHSVLLCNYQTSSEGTNFSETDCALFFHFDRVSLEKARQSMGRIRRKNSVHDRIKVYFFEHFSPTQFIRGRLNQKYAFDLKIEWFQKKPEGKMNLILQQMSKDGYQLENLSGEDLLRCFTTDHVSPPEIHPDQFTLPFEKIIAYGQM